MASNDTHQSGCQWREHIEENARVVSDLKVVRRKVVNPASKRSVFFFHVPREVFLSFRKKTIKNRKEMGRA